MGARIHFAFLTGEGKPPLVLYSHWGADSWREDLAFALRAAQPRWDDESYGVRIAISYLIGPQWANETGYGLYIGDGDYWDESVEIDWVNKVVDGHSFEDFCNYHGVVTEGVIQ